MTMLSAHARQMGESKNKYSADLVMKLNCHEFITIELEKTS